MVFSPTAVGVRQASLTVSDNAPGNPQSIPVSGTGVSPLPAVTLMPGSLSFAVTGLGSSTSPQNVTVTNSGSAPLHIASVLAGGADPADFQVSSACSGAIPVGSSCSISVTFAPVGAGQRIATIVISDDAPNSPQTAQMAGTGLAPPGTAVVKLTPVTISFGTVTQGTTAGGQLITLTSAGTGALHIANVALGGPNAGDFSLSNNCTAPAYAVGASCTIGVSISPLATGGRAAFISVKDDAPNSPQTIGLNATVTAALTISPAAPGANAITVTAGQTAAFSLQLTPGAGFAGNASFACAGAPALATCTAPNVQISGGAPIPYVVSVATAKGSMIVTPQSRRLPPPHLFWVTAYGGIVVLLLYLFRLRDLSSTACLLRAASLALLVSVCLFETAGCGGGGTTAAPQNTPSVQVAGGTPTGTSIITLRSAVTNSNGTPLPGIAPIQLTLTVQ
jgi:Abnormal spindle-like microcephaly-assoc'd, ASPM-SPD-2-Hydin